MPAETYDVIQIGYGPVSQSLAQMLGQQGRSVAVVERWQERYPLPRAVCIDHELYRVLSANGMGEALAGLTQPGPVYQWFNADWKELLSIPWSAQSISGGPEVNFVHQPTLEKALDAAVALQPTVDVQLGWEAIEISQDQTGVTVTLRELGGIKTRELRGRYLIGCDGANSLVRETIGGVREDRGFEADWLVIDVLLKPGVTIEKLGIPAAGQYCCPKQPTTIVPAGIDGDRVYRRWEFMRLPGVSVEELENEARVWELLRPWAGPEDVELVRHKVYNFRSLMAEKWRDRRVLIAGDAAHVMPPFAGQGMCSGIRDSWNLAWKLGLILDGIADDALLDTYQVERHPHVSQLIDMSIFLGKIICLPDAQAAAERDAAFANGTHPPFPAFPHLSAGLVLRAPDGSLSPGAGALSPHVSISRGDLLGRFDEMIGNGFVVIMRGDVAALGADQLAGLDAIGGHVAVIGADDWRDLDGRLTGFMQANGWDAFVVRPDFYIYGGGTAKQLPAIVDSLFSDLARAGVRVPVSVNGESS